VQRLRWFRTIHTQEGSLTIACASGKTYKSNQQIGVRPCKVTRHERHIIHCLEHDSYQTGEPAYRLPGLHMQVRTVIVRPLVVDYAICEDLPLVFIKGVKPLSP
jgi:hypothetical protein